MFDIDDTVLEARGLGKIYSRYEDATRGRVASAIRQILFGIEPENVGVPQSREFWALHDIDLELKRGQALGIIGLNGSGKTTLLRMLAGQIVPDAGIIRVRGRTASMIDLTAGLQVTASGRRNIYLRGAALGRSREEIEASVDEVIAFTELGDAIEAPVATYSSGMTMRLAFAIMTASVPDILFIDEVLAVGDFKFRQKCLARLRELRQSSAFVMVSHSMNDISRFCDSVIVINGSRKLFEGAPDEGIALYHNLDQVQPLKSATAATPLGPFIDRSELIDDFEFRWIGLEGDGADEAEFQVGGKLQMRVSLRVRFKPTHLIVSVALYDLNGKVLTAFSTDSEGGRIAAGPGQRIEVDFLAPNVVLNPGQYRATAAIVDGAEFLLRTELPSFRVLHTAVKTWGLVSVPYSWKCTTDLAVTVEDQISG